MMTPTILRVGALAAILSVLGLLAVDVVSLDWDGPPDVAASSVLAAGDAWMAVWLVQLAGILLAVPALTVVFRTLDRSEGGGWARLCPPLLIISATLLCAQNLFIAVLNRHVANWPRPWLLWQLTCCPFCWSDYACFVTKPRQSWPGIRSDRPRQSSPQRIAFFQRRA
jgi:hypothetical protein